MEKLSDIEKRLKTFADPNNRSIAEYLENMGRVTLDLFISYDGNIEDIADEIGGLLGMKLKKETDEFGEYHYMFRCLEIEFVLYGNHGLDDGGGIIFSDYNYQMQILKLYSGEKYKSYDTIYNNIAVFLTEKLSLAFNASAILVDNLQSVVFSTVMTA